jgi:cupin superfamily acireductone dioxygenase involved in methionine salvage
VLCMQALNPQHIKQNYESTFDRIIPKYDSAHQDMQNLQSLEDKISQRENVQEEYFCEHFRE